MIDPSKNKLACIFLSVVTFVIVGFETLHVRSISGLFSNYLFQCQNTLDRHVISIENNSNIGSIILLGSSGTAGSPTPTNSTIADFMNQSQSHSTIYNLATITGTLLTAITILEISPQRPIESIIIGVSPELFPKKDYGSPWISTHVDKVSSILPNEILDEALKSRTGKFDTLQTALNRRLPCTPTRLHKEVSDFFWKLGRKIYGNRFYSDRVAMKSVAIDDVNSPDNFLMKLVPVLKHQTLRRNSRLFVYLEPMLKPDEIYGKEKFLTYITRIKSLLDSEKINYIDLIHALPETNEYFVDFLHLTPKGNQRVAELLLTSLQKEQKSDHL